MGLHSRLGTCPDRSLRLVHRMDIETLVKLIDLSRVYTVYTYYYRVYKVRERGRIGAIQQRRGYLGNSIEKVG